MCRRRLRNRLANQAMDQTPHRAARASLAALVIADRWADTAEETRSESEVHGFDVAKNMGCQTDGAQTLVLLSDRSLSCWWYWQSRRFFDGPT